jgi:polyisoprenyl-teichoic acid--peptidoglycan teichoic acid transferase
MRKQILIAVVAMVIVVGVVVGWYVTTQRHVGRLIAQGKRTNILLMGLDDVGGSRRSDTMMVLSLSPQQGADLISVPRDLRVKFDGNFHKLNAAYSLGGAKLARETVSSLLGIDIPFYITLNYTGFQHLIDLLGGVTITVDEPMKYDDDRATPPLHIDIQPGTQTFDGKTALDYMRYRGATGDLGRIARQQKLIEALLKKGEQDRSSGEIRGMIKTVYPYLHTDLSLIDLYDLAKLVRGIDLEKMQIATVPGTPVTIDKIDYLEPEAVEMEVLVARLIRGVSLLSPDEVHVAVYNGNGVRMMATRTADFLKQKGFQVTQVGNADAFTYQKTYVVVLTQAAKAWVLERALPGGASVVAPKDLGSHYAALPAAPSGTDVLLITGAGFTVGS